MTEHLGIEERVDYYLGPSNKKKFNLRFNTKTQQCFWSDENNTSMYEEIGRLFHKKWIVDKDFSETQFLDESRDNPIAKVYDIDAYIKPIITLFESDPYFLDKKFLARFGDVFFSIPIPVICKTRPTKYLKGCSVIIPNIKNQQNESITTYETCNVIINLEKDRHWDIPIDEVKKHDIPFHEKNNKLIWRGGFTGFGWGECSSSRPSRKILCEKFSAHWWSDIDIGPIGILPSTPEQIGCIPSKVWTYNGKIKTHLSISTQLRSKFIISIEGGDVATNLKWILYSNSVPLMTKPTMCSWLMEDKLEPGVHYVLLDDQFDDLEEKYEWCLNNLDKCEEIAKNGKKYIEQFLDEEREAKINNLVLRRYVDNVKINLI